MTTLALDPTHLTFLRRQAMNGAPLEEWALALCTAHPQLHGRFHFAAFALALHAPTVAGWSYVARRFGHVARIPTRLLAPPLNTHAAIALQSALATANESTRPALARWRAQLAAREAS